MPTPCARSQIPTKGQLITGLQGSRTTTNKQTNPFSTRPFDAVFTTFRKLAVIQLIRVKKMQTAHKMKEKGRGSLLIDLDLKISF